MDNACPNAYKTDMPGYGSVKLDACLRSNHTVLWTFTQPCILIWIWIWIWQVMRCARPVVRYIRSNRTVMLAIKQPWIWMCIWICHVRNSMRHARPAIRVHTYTSHQYVLDNTHHMPHTRSNTCTLREHTHMHHTRSHTCACRHQSHVLMHTHMH